MQLSKNRRVSDVCSYRVPCAFSLNVTANYTEILKKLMFK